MLNITKTAAVAFAGIAVIGASAAAEEPVHAAPVEIDLTQLIAQNNAKLQDKLYEVVMAKAEAAIDLKLAKIENAPIKFQLADSFRIAHTAM